MSIIENNQIFIGDNLEVMKSDLFCSYKGNIDFIYIDPPYNTTNFFSYNDNNIIWKNDIVKRLVLAKELLSESGVIFISIDDNELVALLEACNDVFCKSNFVGIFITKQAQRSNAKFINITHEYIVCFAKNKAKLPKFYIKRLDDPRESRLLTNIIKNVKKEFQKSKELGYKILKKSIENYIKEIGETWIKNYTNIDDNGRIYFTKDLSTPGEPKCLDIDEIKLHLKPLKTRGWSSKEKFLKLAKENRLVYKQCRPYEVEYIDEAVNNVYSILDFYSRQGTNDLKKLNLDGLFDTPKPVELIKYLIRVSQHKDAVVLDFYAGSGTTAQAVYELNKEGCYNHKYILIQLDEPANKNSKTHKFLTKIGMENPTISDAMLLRIDTFLKKHNMKKDYIVHSSTATKQIDLDLIA